MCSSLVLRQAESPSRMPLPCSPRCGRQRRACVLLLTAVLLHTVPVSASLPAQVRCPSPLDCVQQRRHQCQPGSSDCGLCLYPFQENEHGLCVLRTRHQHGKVTPYSDLDEEIDFIHSVIEKQEVFEKKPSKNQQQHAVSISFEADVKDSKTNASKQKLLPDKSLRGSTTAPRPSGTAVPKTPTSQPRATGNDNRAGPIVVPRPKNDTIIVIMISLCVVVGSVAVILATICFIKFQNKSRLAEKVDYPGFGGPGVTAAPPTGSSMGDKSLAQSAQMYHYHHQKQQMLSMGNHKPEQKVVDSEVTSDEEEVGGGFTVYECPGLAPTGEMEVKNPLFDDSTIDYQGNHK
ncbi:neural proliferation differentiation and control protein 1a [Cololabis saira]|uniref:neural proliferation differentiation and control protein 1a n=1 Tax=Cololabis saira TaxID=129043 RepID=UPI002AD2734D|nr:neural proliferation differentiation and control protein 1a [Cololabis saira]